jgi:hypothetical protein
MHKIGRHAVLARYRRSAVSVRIVISGHTRRPALRCCPSIAPNLRLAHDAAMREIGCYKSKELRQRPRAVGYSRLIARTLTSN